MMRRWVERSLGSTSSDGIKVQISDHSGRVLRSDEGRGPDSAAGGGAQVHHSRYATTGYLLGLAAITLALGATYRLMREPSDP
jgi:hypothetical protein